MTAAVSVTLMGPAASLGRTAARFESTGVDRLWTGDYFQSGLVRAAIIAAATTRVAVGTHVLQAFARSPLATALAAQELQSLSGGRYVLGLGSQLPAANRRWHGVEIATPVAALRDYVAALRTLFTTPGACDFNGTHFAFRVPPFRGPADEPPPPFWIGGAGPATVRLAAEVADGVAGHLLWTYAHVRDHVAPHTGALPVTVTRLVAVHTVTGWRADLIRRVAHYLVTPAYHQLLARQGIVFDRDELLRAVRTGDAEAMAATVEPYLAQWCIWDAAGLQRHRAEAAAHGVAELVLFVPSDPGEPARTSAYEGELADLLSAG
jgi:alkanesulfonate monooxygenase SsuD/methylene tetrahydromethanopterin reductase-like flavin-dependent oxidoreductase (luciferase family)